VRIAKEKSCDAVIQDVSETRFAFNAEAKILVVDDHPVNLLFLRNVLKDFGFSCIVEASNGLEALKSCEESNFDLVLMDCQMPEMDGFTTARHIREKENPACSPVIVAVTADIMKGIIDKCTAAGMSDYISKPVEIEKLRSILKKWLPYSAQEMDSIKIQEGCQTPEALMFDWNRLDEFTRGDLEEEHEAIALFSESAQDTLKELETSLKDGNHEKWEQHAHKLRGSAANLGAQVLANICCEAEKLTASDQQEKEETLKKIVIRYKQLGNILQSGRP
jgi:CheY-like chemotaxis protein/HPt (histidine-containing phosphotransfer) domain-containing protein